MRKAGGGTDQGFKGARPRAVGWWSFPVVPVAAWGAPARPSAPLVVPAAVVVLLAWRWWLWLTWWWSGGRPRAGPLRWALAVGLPAAHKSGPTRGHPARPSWVRSSARGGGGASCGGGTDGRERRSPQACAWGLGSILPVCPFQEDSSPLWGSE